MDISTQRAIHRDVWSQLWERGLAPTRIHAASTYSIKAETTEGPLTAYFTLIKGKYKVTDIVSETTEMDGE